MAKYKLKIEAENLRKNGASLKQIMEKLGISKSTASFWCRDIILSEEQKKLLKQRLVEGGHSGRIIGAEANHRKKVLSIKLAANEATSIIKDVTTRDILIAGIALYWAEGSKASSTSGFILVNSDPIMIKFMYNWLINIMKVPKTDIYGQVSINEIHKPREEQILNFWSNLLDLPRSQFNKTFFMKVLQKKVYSNHEEYYGVFRIGVRRSSYLKYKTLALIGLLKADVAQVVRANAS